MKILQTQQAVTEPYCRFAVDLDSRLTRGERLLNRLVGGPIAAAFELFLRRNRYDVVVTCHYRTSLIFGMLTKLLGRNALHVVKELYLDESVLGSSFARSVFRWALSKCDGVITNCSAEIAAYSEFLGLPQDRFHFLPWPSNLPLGEGQDDGYIFAAGRSFRDWQVLFDAARVVDTPFVVVAEAWAVAGLKKPANVTLCCDTSRATYLELLRNAHIVAVPLLQTVRSTGQATILEAMAFAKPVVTTRTPGVADYVTHGVNGLLYEPGDCASLVEQLNRLRTAADLRRQISEGGVQSIRTTFNKGQYAQRMADLMRELLSRTKAVRAGSPSVMDRQGEPHPAHPALAGPECRAEALR